MLTARSNYSPLTLKSIAVERGIVNRFAASILVGNVVLNVPIVGQGLCSCRSGRDRQLLCITKMQRMSCLPLMPIVMLLLLNSRKLLICRSCRGWQLLLPITAKVTKNALGSVGKTTRRMCSAQPQPISLKMPH